MENIRKSYMTLCFRDNVEVTHIVRNGIIEITYEKAVPGGFNTLVMDIDGNILSNYGFNNSDIDFFQRFTLTNRPGIIAESKDEI